MIRTLHALGVLATSLYQGLLGAARRRAFGACFGLGSVIARRAASHVAVMSGVVATSGGLVTRARPVSVETMARPARAT